MKQTAVEWFFDQLEFDESVSMDNIEEIFNQAKAMEKEQMIGFAKNFEHIDINKSDMENELNCYLNLEDTEELLKETFKSE